MIGIENFLNYFIGYYFIFYCLMLKNKKFHIVKIFP